MLVDSGREEKSLRLAARVSGRRSQRILTAASADLARAGRRGAQARPATLRLGAHRPADAGRPRRSSNGLLEGEAAVLHL